MKKILTGKMLSRALFQRLKTLVFRTISSQNEPNTVKASIAMYPNFCTSNLPTSAFDKVD
jgi:hypothetical protein